MQCVPLHTRDAERSGGTVTNAHAWKVSDAASMLLRPGPDSHKYTRGVLALHTGSTAYPGAAVLGAEAAWRTGIGLVRFVPQRDDSPSRSGLPTPAAAVISVRPETVVSHDPSVDRARSDAWLIGSGTDPDARSTAETRALLELLRGDVPVVADAGALSVFATANISAPTIITPHRGELSRLIAACGIEGHSMGDRSASESAASAVATRLGVTVLLKGSETIAVSPSGLTLVAGPATPWLATAGTGDVLAGIVGSLLAATAADQHTPMHLDTLALLGASAAIIHDLAARRAAGPAHGQPITALDVAHHVSDVIAELLASEG